MARRSAAIVFVVAFSGAFAACGWDWTVIPTAGADAATEASSPPDGGKPEGGKGTKCKGNDQCAPNEVCEFADFRCGAGLEGDCLVPYDEATCPSSDPSIACGCDGQTAKDRCSVGARRTDLSTDAKCTAPPDTFRCGFLFCPKTAYCFEARTPEYSDFVCIPWQCTEKDCACSETTSKCEVSTCSTDGSGGTLIVCTKLEGK